MNITALTPLFSLIINLTLWVLIHSGIKKTKISSAYLVYISLISSYFLIEFINLSISDLKINLIILRHQCIFWILAPIFFLNFVYTVSNYKNLPLLNPILCLYIPILYIATQTNLVVHSSKPFSWGNDIVSGTLFLPIIILTFLIPILIALIQLIYIILKKSSTKFTNRHSLFILIGTILTIIPIIIIDIVLPHMLYIDTYPRIGSAAITIQSLFIFFAIFFYSFLEIKIDIAIGYIFRHSSNSILIINPDHTIRYANHAARHLLSGHNADMFGTNISKILKNDDEYDINFNFTNKKAWIGTKTTLTTFLISQINVKDWNTDFGKILVIKPTRREIQ